MQAAYCPHCGAPVSPGSQFCSYCGTAIPGGSAPLPSALGPNLPPTPPPASTMPYGSGSGRPPRRHRGVIIAVIVVVLILIVAGVAFVVLSSHSDPIQVAFINVWAPDNVCGLNTYPIGYYGYNDTSTGATQIFDFPVPNYNVTPCTVQSVITNTTGFSLSAIEVPLPIPGNGTGSMNITITSPSSDYSGNLNLVFA